MKTRDVRGEAFFCGAGQGKGKNPRGRVGQGESENPRGGAKNPQIHKFDKSG